MEKNKLTAKEYLSQAYRIDRRIDSKLEQVQSLRDLAEKATANLTDMPRSSTPNVHRMEDVIAKMVDLESEINDDLTHLIDLKHEITTVIKCVEDPELQTLLEMRYLCFEKWEEIAVALHFDLRWVHRLHKRAEREKIILVFDEFPYFAKSNESALSILQQHIDLHFLKTNMMLILAGSSLSFMQNQVLGYQSPLYGRRSAQIKLLPVDFQTARLFVPELPKLDQAVIYGVTGGIPKYLSLMSDRLSLDENLEGQFFDSNAYMFEETTNLLKQEFNDPSLYQSIITAIASGSSQMKDIKGKVGEESSTVATYMKALLDTGVVKKEVPIMDKPDSRKTLYRLEDGMFRFWYRFVYPNVSPVSIDRGEQVYRRIKPQISAFMGEVFEKLCIEYMWSIYDDLPFGFQNIGRWWGNNPELKSEAEIDFIAHSEDHTQAIFGECKWTNEPIDRSIVAALMEKSGMFRQFTQKYYYLFAKSGFTDGARELAGENENIRLISFADMYNYT